MTPAELHNTLNELIALPAETEWVEFKEAKGNFHFPDLGKYFSALSNEANLRRQAYGWLVFGVKDKPRGIVGSQYRPHRPALDRLKQEIANHTTNHMTFQEIYELTTSKGRVVMFQIPAAMRGMPTAWQGHYYGRYGESLGPLTLNEIEQIRQQAMYDDWSAHLCDGATLDDLDPEAIRTARQQYKEKFPRLADEVDQWDDLTFLNKAKVCLNGRITKTAIVLLGKDEASHYLLPARAWITWVLKEPKGPPRDYAHFGAPLLLAVDQVFARVRNLIIRYLPANTLFPHEVTQYDPWVMRELLHNCIAHQDYRRGGRINVVEEPEALLFTNLGQFLPGSIEDVIRHNASPEEHRNPFLAQAMFNLNMIDTIGSGIIRTFTKQRERFFPLPDYDLSEPERVQVRLFGKILDENYTRLLMEKADLDLLDVIALDKVQKGYPLTDDEYKSLRSQKLVEGRRSHLYVSTRIAAIIGEKARDTKYRALDKQRDKETVLSFLRQYGKATRKEIEDLLMDKFSDPLNEQQKRNRIRNLLSEMAHKDRTLIAVGPRKTAEWRLRSESEDVSN